MDLSGLGVVRCPPWVKYLHEIPKLFQSQELGPATVRPGEILMFLMEHLMFSVVAGVLAMGLGWVWSRITARKIPA